MTSQATPVAFESFAPAVYAAWVYCNARLGDKRLLARLVIIAAQWMANPRASIPRASGDWAGAKGAYRFLQNERITVNDLVLPLADAAHRACRGLATVLAVQDSTAVSFNNAKHTLGLGPVDDKDSRGIWMHSTLALREDGVALGLLDLKFWCRPPHGEIRNDRDAVYKKLPITEKESVKWLEGIQRSRAALQNLPPDERPRVIHVGDREEDIFDVFEEIVRHGEDAVIRCAQDRLVKVNGTVVRARQALAATQPQATLELEIPRTKTEPARTASVELRALAVEVQPPQAHRANHGRAPLALNLVQVLEVAAPLGVEPVEWLLWTTEACATQEEILRVVRIYCSRWRIEDYHKTLKSGCQVEELQLETAERLKKALALYAPIAVFILRLRDLARTEPEAPCTVVLDDTEQRVLYTRIEGHPPEPGMRVMSLRQAVLWIGRLGGHLNRKSDGMPGVKTLWLGWCVLMELVSYERARQQPAGKTKKRKRQPTPLGDVSL